MTVGKINPLTSFLGSIQGVGGAQGPQSQQPIEATKAVGANPFSQYDNKLENGFGGEQAGARGGMAGKNLNFKA